MKLIFKSAALFLLGCVVSLFVIVAITQMQRMPNHRVEALFVVIVYYGMFAAIPIAAFSFIMTALAVTTRRSPRRQFAVTLLTALLIPLGFFLISSVPGTTMKPADRADVTVFAVKYIYIPAIFCCLTIVFAARKLFRPSAAPVQSTFPS